MAIQYLQASQRTPNHRSIMFFKGWERLVIKARILNLQSFTATTWDTIETFYRYYLVALHNRFAIIYCDEMGSYKKVLQDRPHCVLASFSDGSVFCFETPFFQFIEKHDTQCDQLGNFLKFLVKNTILTKVAQISSEFWAIKKHSFSSKNVCDYFKANFWKHLGNFLFQHLVPLTRIIFNPIKDDAIQLNSQIVGNGERPLMRI